jgi:hypothetical protein
MVPTFWVGFERLVVTSVMELVVQMVQKSLRTRISSRYGFIERTPFI